MAPYSGAMLAIVARSASFIAETPGPKILHELAHHARLAQDLRDGQHQVGGGGAGRQLAGQFEADHLGHQHVQRLAEHHRLGLDAAHAPADARPIR